MAEPIPRLPPVTIMMGLSDMALSCSFAFQLLPQLCQSFPVMSRLRKHPFAEVDDFGFVRA